MFGLCGFKKNSQFNFKYYFELVRRENKNWTPLNHQHQSEHVFSQSNMVNARRLKMVSNPWSRHTQKTTKEFPKKMLEPTWLQGWIRYRNIMAIYTSCTMCCFCVAVFIAQDYTTRLLCQWDHITLDGRFLCTIHHSTVPHTLRYYILDSLRAYNCNNSMECVMLPVWVHSGFCLLGSAI